MNASEDYDSLSESLFLGISCTLLVAIFLPLYLMVIWVLATNKLFEGVTLYRVLEHFAIANVLSLFSAFMSGIFELTRSTFYDVIDITSGSLSVWFRVMYCMLMLLIAINRLSVFFDFTIPYENDIHKYLIFLVWYALMVLVLMTVYLRIDFRYEFDIHMFHTPTDLLDKPVWLVRHVTSVMNVVIMLKLLYMKYVQKRSINATSLNIFLQTLALHFPPELLSIASRTLAAQIEAYSKINILYLFVFRAIPAVTISLLLLLNRELRKCTCDLRKQIVRRAFW